MGSASMLLASSGMFPHELCAYFKSYELCARDHELCRRLAGNMPARGSRMLARSNRAALLTRPRHRDHQFAVLLGDEVFGAAG